MNYKDVQKKTDAELAELVQENRVTLRDVRFGTAGAGSRDLKKVRDAKQTIAWCLTEMNARRHTNTPKS